MRRAIILVLGGALFAGSGAKLSAGQAREHAERKVVSRVAPEYPVVAKRNRIKGLVRLELVVLANGQVRSAKVLGGNPVLIGPATDAVRKWRFEASAEQTTEIVQVTFDPD